MAPLATLYSVGIASITQNNINYTFEFLFVNKCVTRVYFITITSDCYPAVNV